MARHLASASSEHLQVESAVVGGPACSMLCRARSDNVSNNQTLMYVGVGSAEQGMTGIRFLSGALQAYTFEFAFLAAQQSGASNNTWHCVGGTFGSFSDRVAWLDGSSTQNTSSDSSSGSYTRTSLGALRRLSPLGYLNGDLAEAAFYDEKLSADQMAAHADGFSPLMIAPGAMASYYSLLEDVSTERDLVGGNDMIESGAIEQIDHPLTIYPCPPIVMQAIVDSGGGPDFTQAVSGSISPAGDLDLTVAFAAAVAGSISPTGALSKLTRVSLFGTTSPEGSATKRVRGMLSSTLTLTGALTRKTRTAISGTISAAGAVAVKWKQTVTGSFSPSGALSSVLNVGGGAGGFKAWLKRRRGHR